MKEKIKILGAWQLQARAVFLTALDNPAMQAAVQCLVRFSMCFLLANVSVRGMAMPFGLCLLVLSGHGVLGLSALLGCLLGYIGQFGLLGCLEPLASCILIYAASLTFRELELKNQVWFFPCICTALSGLVCLLYLIDNAFRMGAILIFAAKLAICFGATYLFQKAITNKTGSAQLFLGGCLVAGLGGISLFTIPLGVVAAVGLCISALFCVQSLPIAAICGLALDLTLQPVIPLTALFCFASLLCKATGLQSKPLLALIYTGCCTAAVLFFHGANAELVIAAFLGAAVCLVIPETVFPAVQSASAGSVRAVTRQLEHASDILEEIQLTLQEENRAPTEPEAALVFDRAAEKVCKCCVLYGSCWNEHSTQTYRCLCSTVRPMLEHGQLTREDFPQGFAEHCRHMDGFITAVNQELDNILYRRQFRNRLKETRTVVSDQYGFISDFLRTTASHLQAAPQVVTQFLPQLGVCAAGKKGSRISGDRGASFKTDDGRYFVLLCDGMGTGSGAAEESANAVSTLSGLLLSGMPAEHALQTLNGIYILRGDGGFSTIDLLEVDLVTGIGSLYKWGAAPSYLKLGQTVKKIGTVSPPPGFGVGTTYKAERIGLSLQKGEMLVLLSDGAGGEDTESRLMQLDGLTPREVADSIIAGAQTEGEDDMTAAVLCLHPCLAP